MQIKFLMILLMMKFMKLKIKESGEIKYKLKCNTPHQMAAYYGAFMSIPFGMFAIPHIRVPICHVIGSKGVWNPPESITWIRGAINKNSLLVK